MKKYMKWLLLLVAIGILLFFNLDAAHAEGGEETAKEIGMMAYISMTAMAGAIVLMGSAPKIHDRVHHMPHGWKKSFMHILAEGEQAPIVAVVVALAVAFFAVGMEELSHLVGSVSIIEPVFVGAIYLCASTTHIGLLMTDVMNNTFFRKIYERFGAFGYLGVHLISVPILGGISTEPVAGEVLSKQLHDAIKDHPHQLPDSFLYRLLGVSATNVSIGGGWITVAAPAVVVLAAKWGMSILFMLLYAMPIVVALVVLNTMIFLYQNREIIRTLKLKPGEYNVRDSADVEKVFAKRQRVQMVNIIFMIAIIATFLMHSLNGVLIATILFVGYYDTVREPHERLKYKSALVTALFLLSLIVLGHGSEPILYAGFAGLSMWAIYALVGGLTGVLDNALLAFVVASIFAAPSTLFMLLVIGACLCAGGVSLLANAPNVILKQNLQNLFENGQISAIGWLKGAFQYALLSLILWAIYAAIVTSIFG